MISNTTASIDGTFPNEGTTTVVNATANFFSQIGNHGLLTLQKSTLNATAINFGSGTIHGNGTISDDVSSLGTISPAGTLTFGGNLTLLGSSVVIMELTGYGNGVGTNDVINVAENFQYAGKLVVTNTTGFAYAPGQSFQLFNFSTQTGQFSATNLPDSGANRFGVGHLATEHQRFADCVWTGEFYGVATLLFRLYQLSASGPRRGPIGQGDQQLQPRLAGSEPDQCGLGVAGYLGGTRPAPIVSSLGGRGREHL